MSLQTRENKNFLRTVWPSNEVKLALVGIVFLIAGITEARTPQVPTQPNVQKSIVAQRALDLAHERGWPENHVETISESEVSEP